MRVIEILCQNGDVQAIEPVCTEDRFVLQVSPEHSVLQGMQIPDLACSNPAGVGLNSSSHKVQHVPTLEHLLFTLLLSAAFFYFGQCSKAQHSYKFTKCCVILSSSETEVRENICYLADFFLLSQDKTCIKQVSVKRPAPRAHLEAEHLFLFLYYYFCMAYYNWRYRTTGGRGTQESRLPNSLIAWSSVCAAAS